MTSKAKAEKTPLSLEQTLHDLALLRASDVDFAAILGGKTSEGEGESEVDGSVARSYEFVAEARKAIRVEGRGEVGKEGERLEGVRGTLEDAVNGLEGVGLGGGEQVHV